MRKYEEKEEIKKSEDICMKGESRRNIKKKLRGNYPTEWIIKLTHTYTPTHIYIQTQTHTHKHTQQREIERETNMIDRVTGA